MKTLIFVLLVLLAAILATLYAVKDPGYVLIARTPWSVEMPLTLFIPLALAAGIAVYAATRTVIRLVTIPNNLARWRTKRRTRRARETLMQGLIHLAEGEWTKAESQLIAGLQTSDAPAVNYLAAACASQGQGDIERRDEYLSEAHKRAPDQAAAVGMTQASLQYLARQYEQALATLTELHSKRPPPRYALQLLARVYRRLQDWTGLAHLLPELRRHRVMTEAQLDALEQQTHQELLRAALPNSTPETAGTAWQATPKALRQRPALIALYTRRLIELDQAAEAERLLREALERTWEGGLVELYGRVRAPDLGRQLSQAEEWLQHQGEDPVLLLALGRIAVAHELWGKARHYLERAIAREPRPEAYRELGRLLEQLGETQAALAAYRQGLEAQAGPARRTGTDARALQGSGTMA